MRWLALGLLALLWACEDEARRAEAPLVVIDAAGPSAEVGLPPLNFDAGPRPDAAPDAVVIVDAAPDVVIVDAVIDAAPDAGPSECDLRLQEGLDWLAAAQPRLALKSFEAALELCPEDPNILFAAALAGAYDGIELTVMLFSVITNQAKGSRTEVLVDSIHDEFMGLRADLVLALERADAVDPTGLDLVIEAAPLYIGLTPRLVLRGALDEGDLRLFQAAISMCAGLLEVIAVQSLDTELFEAVGALLGGFGGLDYGTITGLLSRLLESPNFLTVEPDDGAEVYASARAHFSAVGARLNEAAAWMKAAPEDARPQVSDWRRDTLRVQGVVREGAEVTYELDLDEALLATLQRASEAINAPGERLDFQQEVIPILSVLLHYAAGLGLLDGLSDSLPPLGGLPRPLIAQLLQGLLPIPIALDLGTFLATPTGLRVFMPASEGGGFIVEWECPEDIGPAGHPSAVRGFLCDEAAALVDGPHFSGEHAIEADGNPSRAPYFVWADPSLQGLIWVDRDAYGLEGGWAPTDGQTINLVLGDLLAQVLGLLP